MTTRHVCSTRTADVRPEWKGATKERIMVRSDTNENCRLVSGVGTEGKKEKTRRDDLKSGEDEFEKLREATTSKYTCALRAGRTSAGC